ncbi:protein of unknown function [Azospirillum baldaniorum]|uniref:Uncharacterized protein n=1 Tax=Azospirillum baldaniorum TaxID=1064539 RepID=A0A9P1JPA3_9PROT|nr:protein of unknown function [Azospirillum baldaniorum]
MENKKTINTVGAREWLTKLLMMRIV